MTIDLDARERAELADAGIAIFEDRIILAAQPPAPDDVLADIASHIARELPADLVSLWRVACGGRVDYEARCAFSERRASFSVPDDFVARGGGYDDIRVWIEHVDYEAHVDGAPGPVVLDVLPIGSFDYLESFYVVTAAENRGSVWAHTAEPRPVYGWNVGPYREGGLARAAADLRGFFRTLALETDPWVVAPEAHRAGGHLRDAIDRLGSRTIADKLRALARATVLDWRSALADGTLARRDVHRRFALEHAARTNDVELLERLLALGCDPRETVRWGADALDFAVLSGSKRAALWLLDHHAPVRNALRNGAGTVDLELARDLAARGAVVDEHAVMAALDKGDIDVVLFLAEWPGIELMSLRHAIRARERAQDAEQLARKAEAAAIANDVRPAVLRASASRLQELADRIDPTLRRP